jgi:hypothetical protein
LISEIQAEILPARSSSRRHNPASNSAAFA